MVLVLKISLLNLNCRPAERRDIVFWPHFRFEKVCFQKGNTSLPVWKTGFSTGNDVIPEIRHFRFKNITSWSVTSGSRMSIFPTWRHSSDWNRKRRCHAYEQMFKPEVTGEWNVPCLFAWQKRRYRENRKLVNFLWYLPREMQPATETRELTNIGKCVINVECIWSGHDVDSWSSNNIRRPRISEYRSRNRRSDSIFLEADTSDLTQ